MTSGRPAFRQHAKHAGGSDTTLVSHTRKGPEHRAYKPQFRQKKKDHAAQRGRDACGTATRISASLFRRLSAFFWSTPGQDPKAAKFVVLTPGPGMFVNVQFVSRVMIAPHPKCPLFRRVSPCVPSQERKRIMIVLPGILNSFWPIFDAPKSGQEKGIGAFRANAYSQQPAVRAAARVCGFWKLTLFSRFPERFDAKFGKSHRKAPCHNGLRRRFDRKSVCFM